MAKNNKIRKYKKLEKREKVNKKSIIVIIGIILIIAIIIFLIKFNNNTAKIHKIGNNSSSQEIVDYISNISSYEATIEVEVNSNKNSNKYKIKQQYINDGIHIQEVIEPTNIAGVKIIKDGENLKIENTKFNLSTVFEKYNYVSDNCLDLISFIENFKNCSESKYEEKNEQVIMETVDNSNEKNIKYKELYIDKNTGTPIKMEIKDTNKNTTIYIIYNEVKVNSLK